MHTKPVLCFGLIKREGPEHSRRFFSVSIQRFGLQKWHFKGNFLSVTNTRKLIDLRTDYPAVSLHKNLLVSAGSLNAETAWEKRIFIEFRFG